MLLDDVTHVNHKLDQQMGSNLYRLSENSFADQKLYYILINHYDLSNL